MLSSQRKNCLLSRDDVGQAKPSTRMLPHHGFTYGKAEIKDKEGVGVITRSWNQHETTEKGKNDKDFKILNKKAIGSKATNAKTVYNFRKQADVRIKEPTLGAHKLLHLPEQGFTYGKPLRPSTPIRDVIGNFYGDVAENHLQTKYHIIE